MQVYRGMDIGTAKASLEERERIPHHLIDIRDISESFNVVDFYTEAMLAVEEIFDRGHIPVIVGGTGFYIHSLLYGPPAGPSSVHKVRMDLEEEMRQVGPLVLYEKLKHLDPDYAASITQSDRHKIIRALEIISLTNRRVSQFPKETSRNQENFDFRCWFIHVPREILYPRIEMRCDKMIADGLIEEVKRLSREGLKNNCSASQAIGYRQCLEFLDSLQGQAEWDRFVSEFKTASRRYAKRQFTWFRKEPLFRWLDTSRLTRETAAEMILQDYEMSF
jgi:tRNA dimethylallyltransferase